MVESTQKKIVIVFDYEFRGVAMQLKPKITECINLSRPQSTCLWFKNISNYRHIYFLNSDYGSNLPVIDVTIRLKTKY
jgi:hypothetical protein